MRTVFQSDFQNPGSLASWTREQHTPPGYPDFQLHEGKLEFLDAGNRIIPHVPAVSEFQTELSFSVCFPASENCFSLTFHFDYDPSRRQGKKLEIASDGKDVQLYWNGKIQKIKNSEKIFQTILREQSIILAVERKKDLAVSVNDNDCFETDLPAGSGIMALERGHFAGSLYLASFQVAAPLEEPESIQFLKLPFAPVNGMPNPIFWEAEFLKNGDKIMMKTKLSGGVTERPDIPWFPYHGSYAESLTAPYFRIQLPSGEKIPLRMSEKKLRLAKGHSRFYYMPGIGFEKPEWPMERTFYLNFFDPQKILLICGYESYLEPVCGKAFMGGPSEMVYDVAEGKTVYAGCALTSDRIQVELRSAQNARLMKEIPADHPLREKAEQFLLLNHFFFEKESCIFHFEITVNESISLGEFSMEYALADCFMERISDWKQLKNLEVIRIASGINRFQSAKISFGKLKGGVYHVLFRCHQGNRLLVEDNRSFEVMTETLSGPQASGFPILYSTPCEVSGVDSNEFDPFLNRVSDVCHYVDTAAGVMPHIAEEQQVAPLYKLFRRKWFPWFTPRTTQNQDFRNYPSISSCDYIAMVTEWQKKCLVRICSRAFYTGPQMELLAKYGKERNFHAKELAECVKKEKIPSPEIFQELIDQYFCDWMDYFNDAFRKDLEKMKAQLRKVNPHAGLANYGPLAIYPAAYKTAHSCQYVFSYLTRPGGKKSVYEDGKSFFNFGDYPYCCRHNVLRGPFLTADILLEYPKVRICPEVYTPNDSGPNPDAAVARAWPSLGMKWGGPSEKFPVNTTMKRALEYIYGSVRHDGKSFGYWTERGFHSRTWERSRYQALLRLLGFVRKHEPAHPAGRVCAFLCSEECIRAHKYFYDEYGERDVYTPFGDLFNTAEETPAFAYEMSRFAGMNAGCVVNEKSLRGLSGSEIDVLILPPLTGISTETLKQIQRLHREGVSLFGFEDVSPLEELFGVRTNKQPQQVHFIRPEMILAPELQNLTEYTEHRAAVGRYRASDAIVLLEGEVPVLFYNETLFGKTALFNIPPTVVRREDQVPRVAMGRDSVSPLINLATQHVLHLLSHNDISSTEGKLIAFCDHDGVNHVIVEEDAHPEQPHPISPLVTIRGKSLVPKVFHCPEGCSVVEHTADRLKLRLHLKEDEYKIISLN